jgi:hypothetical protein
MNQSKWRYLQFGEKIKFNAVIHCFFQVTLLSLPTTTTGDESRSFFALGWKMIRKNNDDAFQSSHTANYFTKRTRKLSFLSLSPFFSRSFSYTCATPSGCVSALKEKKNARKMNKCESRQRKTKKAEMPNRTPWREWMKESSRCSQKLLELNRQLKVG